MEYMPMVKEQGRPLIYVCLGYFTLGQLRRVRELIYLRMTLRMDEDG